MEEKKINIKYGFKAFDKDLKCKDFQYEIGAIYDLEKKPIICARGYHFCDSIEKVYNYYPRTEETRVCIVEILGDIDATDKNGNHFSLDNNGVHFDRDFIKPYHQEDNIFSDFDFNNIDKYCTNKIKIVAEIKNPLDSVKIYFSRKKDKSSLPKTINNKLKAPKIGELIYSSSKYDMKTRQKESFKLICISKQKGKYIFSFDKCVGKSSIDGMNTFLDNFIGNEDILLKEYWNIIEEVFIPSEYEVFGSWIYGKSDDEPWKPFEYYKYLKNRQKSSAWWMRSLVDSDDTSFCLVNAFGSVSNDNASYARGVAPCFVIDEKYFEESGQINKNDDIKF